MQVFASTNSAPRYAVPQGIIRRQRAVKKNEGVVAFEVANGIWVFADESIVVAEGEPYLCEIRASS